MSPAVRPLVFVHGADAAFLLLTGDAYLYLGIAQASTPEFFSFDGERPTNGFHPLWLRLLSQVIGDAPLALMNAVAWSAQAQARRIARAVARRRPVVVDWRWRLVMGVIRAIPERIWNAPLGQDRFPCVD